MRIGFISMGLNKDGGTRVLCSLANNLAQHHDVYFWGQIEHMPPYNLSSRIHQRLQNVEKTNTRTGQLRALFALYRQLHGDRNMLRSLDYLVCSYYLTAPFAFMFRPKAGSILLMQSWEPGRLRKKVRGLLSRTSYRLPFERIVCVSHWLQKQLPATLKHKSRVIFPGIEEVFLEGAQVKNRDARTTPIQIGTVASSSPNKRFDLFLKTAALLREKNDTQFSFHAALPTNFDSSQLPPYIATSRISRDRDLIQFYQNIDLLLFTSEVEGWSLVPLEAMAQGTPCVVTKCGGIHDFAFDGENALFASDWTPAAFATQILAYAGNHDLYRNISQASIHTARAHPMRRFGKEFNDMLHQMKEASSA